MKKFWIIALAIFVAVVVSVVIWVAWPKAADPTLVSPSGLKVTLLNVTVGPKHVCRYASGWKEFIYPIVPKNLEAKLKARVVSHRTPTNEMMFWFQVEGPVTQILGARGFCFSVMDENGLESRLYDFSTSRTMVSRSTPAPGSTLGPTSRPTPDQLPSMKEVNGWIVNAFPHRAKTLQIRIYEGQPFHMNTASAQSLNEVSFVGEFTVPNPRRAKPATEWTAEALPATRQTNGLEVTLLKLETGLTASGRSLSRNAPEAKSISQATFRLTENGQPATSWMVANLNATAVTGETHSESRPARPTRPNRLNFPPPGATSQEYSKYTEQLRQFQNAERERRALGEMTYDLSDSLWPDEPAWKLGVSLMRTAKFPPEELWVIKNVRVPQTNEFVGLTNSLNLDGQTVELIGVIGPGLELPRTTASGRTLPVTFQREQPARAQVRISLHSSEWQLSLLEVQDEKGRKGSRGTFTSTRSLPSTNLLSATNSLFLREFGFQIPEGAEKLDLIFSVTRARHVEFIVKPTLFTTNQTAPQ